MTKCSVPGCESRFKAKGLCNKHYQRLRANGDPVLTKKTPNGEAIGYFRDVVLQYEGKDCLFWPYGRNVKGYGILTTATKGDSHYVHRLVCEAAHGAPPTQKHEAAHSCGTPPCVAKNHLSWKTREGNQADRLLHGTHNRGEKHNMVKLKEAQVIEIRALKGLETQRSIAKRYGVTFQTISVIQSGRIWSWLKTGADNRDNSEASA